MSRKPSYIKTIVGLNIKKNREIQGLTQEDLSELVSLNTSALSDIECGRTFPKPENLEKIAEALKIPYELLFINNILDPNKVLYDFNRRIEAIKNDPEKFTILYNYLKVLVP